jgi:hypothetical protein
MLAQTAALMPGENDSDVAPELIWLRSEKESGRESDSLMSLRLIPIWLASA